MKSELSTFLTVVIFFLWLCAWGGCTTICCLFHINPGKASFGFFYHFAVSLCAQINELGRGPEGMVDPSGPRPKYNMVRCRICLFALKTTSVSSLCRRIWGYWISKILVRYILSSVCLRLNQFSQLHFMQYMGLCIFNWPISLMVILRICVHYLIIIIKSEA